MGLESIMSSGPGGWIRQFQFNHIFLDTQFVFIQTNTYIIAQQTIAIYIKYTIQYHRSQAIACKSEPDFIRTTRLEDGSDDIKYK